MQHFFVAKIVHYYSTQTASLSGTDPERSGRRDLVQIQLRGTRPGPNGEIDLACSFWPDLAK